MISEDKLRDQALGYTVIPGYDSWPYEVRAGGLS